VVALMVTVVELGFVTSVAAGAAINYFTITVIFTMFAANSFDPRLLWDKKLGNKNSMTQVPLLSEKSFRNEG